MTKQLIFVAFSVLLVSCQTAGQHRQSVESETGDRVTVGTVQREIRVGMSGSDVAAVLGSPNIVSTDKDRNEVWIYDKLSTTTAYSTSSGGVSALVLGVGNKVGGGGAGGYSAESGAASRSQKTLTVIIKFDEEGFVRDFSYRTSRF